MIGRGRERFSRLQVTLSWRDGPAAVLGMLGMFLALVSTLFRTSTTFNPRQVSPAGITSTTACIIPWFSCIHSRYRENRWVETKTEKNEWRRDEASEHSSLPILDKGSETNNHHVILANQAIVEAELLCLQARSIVDNVSDPIKIRPRKLSLNLSIHQ